MSASTSGRNPYLPVAASRIVTRIAAAGLTAAMGIIHYHLWSTGYRHVPTIGDLFVLNAVVGVILAVALLVAPARLLGAVAAFTTLFIAGTLGGLILSLTVGLFGFKEFAGAPFLDDSYVVESAGILFAGILTALSIHPRRWKFARPGNRATSRRPLQKELHP